MSNAWNFKAFREKDSDKNEYEIWLDSLSAKSRARVETRISYYEATKFWPTKYAKKLKGHEKIWELRFTIKNTRYRPLGYQGPGNQEFTILLVSIESGDEFNPRSAPDDAEKRRRLVDKDRSFIDDI